MFFIDCTPRLGRRRRVSAVHTSLRAASSCAPTTAATRGRPSRVSLLPQLTRVKFFDHNRGIAVGDRRVHAAIRRIRHARWRRHLAADADRSRRRLARRRFSRPEAGAVAGAAGRFATLARRSNRPLRRSTSHSLRSFRAMRLLAPTGGWLVGDGGLVLTTNDLGHTWQSPPGELPLRGRAFRLPRPRRPRPTRLDRRLPRHAHLPLARQRPNLAIVPHGPVRAHPRDHVRRRRSRLGRRRPRQHPGHHRRRPHVDIATHRRPTRRPARNLRRRSRRAARSHRHPRRRRRLPHGHRHSARQRRRARFSDRATRQHRAHHQRTPPRSTAPRRRLHRKHRLAIPASARRPGTLRRPNCWPR